MRQGRRAEPVGSFSRVIRRKVAGRERCHEEATRTAPCRPNPTDPGDAADLSIPQGYQCIRKSFSRDFSRHHTRCIAPVISEQA